MKKSDFTKGQTVYLFIIEGSNEFRYVKEKPFSERIKPTTVISVGKKYISVDLRGSTIKFDIDDDFLEVSNYSRNYKLFLDEQSIYDYQESEDLYWQIKQRFGYWQNDGLYDLTTLRQIKEMIEKGEQSR